MRRALAALLLIPACSEYEVVELSITEVFAQPANDQAADLLFVIDDSASMEEEQARLSATFDALAGVLLDSRADFRLGVTTTDPVNNGRLLGGWVDSETPGLGEAFGALVEVGTGGSRDERGLAVVVPALDRAVNGDFHREGARLNVVFFSDEDDHSPLGLQDYLQVYRSLAGSGGVSVHAIVGDMPGGCASGTSAAGPGERYLQAAVLTGGFVESICAEDYVEVLSRIGLEVAGLQDTFVLSYLPRVESLDVRVDGVAIPLREVDGWTWSYGDNAVVFHGRAVPRPGMEIAVKYEREMGSAVEDSGS